MTFRFLLCNIILWLTACSFGPLQPIVVDSLPLNIITPEQVEEIFPRAAPILMTGNNSPYWVNGVKYTVMSSPQGYSEMGLASWYGQKFHNHKTSNGEIFDVYSISAAHRSLPIPSYVRVTNLENRRSIVVRVNDRGPFHADRIIDLSYAAAVKLGFVEKGTSRVQVQYLEVAGVEDRRHPQFGGNGIYFLQLGAFQSEYAANVLKAKLRGLTTESVIISKVELDNAMLYRVRIGPAKDERALLALQKELALSGFGTAKILIE
jgi:rare lipoprotein A